MSSKIVEHRAMEEMGNTTATDFLQDKQRGARGERMALRKKIEVVCSCVRWTGPRREVHREAGVAR